MMQVKKRLFIIYCCLISFVLGFEVSAALTKIKNNNSIEESQSEIAETESVIDEPIQLPHGGASAILNRERTDEEIQVYIRIAELKRSIHYDLINSLTEEDLDLICRIVVLEAGNQSIEGQRAAIEVILNRIMSEYYPDTAYGVLSAEGQFTTWGARDNVSQDRIDEMKVVVYLVRDTPESVFEKYIEENGYTCLPQDYVYFARGRFEWADNHVCIEDHWFETRK